MVINDPNLNRDFRYAIKQNGGMLAKGRLLGLQFLTLFTGGLYQQICQKAVEQAFRISDACQKAGIETYAPSPTNQQFFIFPDEQLRQLEEKYVFSFWEKVDEGRTAVRICTSWATRDQAVDQLIADLLALALDLTSKAPIRISIESGRRFLFFMLLPASRSTRPPSRRSGSFPPAGAR